MPLRGFPGASTSHCYLFWCIELTAEPLEGMGTTLLSPPFSMHNTREAL